jgi:hypothetical protein
MTAADLRKELDRLAKARRDNPRAATAIDDEITQCREAYIGLAATEIASLRAELFGRQWG